MWKEEVGGRRRKKTQKIKSLNGKKST
jgi:hypothetical protein